MARTPTTNDRQRDGDQCTPTPGVAATGVLGAVSFLAATAARIGSAVAHLVTRLGLLYRIRRQRRVPRTVLDRLFDDSMSTITVVVPSRGDDPEGVRTALYSAALQDCPDMRIVLVVDDPTPSSDRRHAATLQATRELPDEINELLSGPGAVFTRTLEAFESRVSPDYQPDGAEIGRVANTYGIAAAWLDQLADNEEADARADHCFRNEVPLSLASDLRKVAAALHEMAHEGNTLDADRVHQLYRRLAWTFRAHVTTFEGRQDGASELSIPDPDYVLIVEPNSLLRPEYCLHVVHLLRRPGRQRVATAQNPLRAFPGSATRFERIVTAKTDRGAYLIRA